MDVCEACGGHARRPDSPERDLRGRDCPKRDLRGRDCPKYGTVHRGCCADEPCSEEDAAGAVRCGWGRLPKAERRRQLREARLAPQGD